MITIQLKNKQQLTVHKAHLINNAEYFKNVLSATNPPTPLKLQINFKMFRKMYSFLKLISIHQKITYVSIPIPKIKFKMLVSSWEYNFMNDHKFTLNNYGKLLYYANYYGVWTLCNLIRIYFSCKLSHEQVFKILSKNTRYQKIIAELKKIKNE